MRSTTTLAVLAFSAITTTSAQSTSSKRGLCYVDTSDASTDDKFWSNSDLTWYYNYEATPTGALSNSGLEFVPMLWGAPTSSSDDTFSTSVTNQISNGAKINYILAFNEPDGCGNQGGSCVDAQTAAETWIRELEPLRTQHGIKLGAPAVTGAPTGFTWLQAFFTQCAGRCHADFIPVHWYGDFQGLASHVGQVNATYPNMTMWVTEFALAEEGLKASQEFYNQSVSWLDTLSYVTHYSYFGAFRSDVSNVGPNAAMLTQKGKLTDIGAWYLGQEATGNKPKGGADQLAKFAGWSVVVLAAVFWTWA